MSNGVGRGRGWLNLKAQNSKSPGSDSPPIINNVPSPDFTTQDNRNFSDASGDYTDLINKIKQLNISDDGIKFNQKIRYIVESWNEDCQNGLEVEKSFNAIYESSLSDADMATKLVLLIASRTFLSQEVHEQNIRLMFLRKLQESFEGCVQLQSSNPVQFRNSVQLMGEFFNKARLANGQQFTFMATPLLSYLEKLLELGEAVDLKLFTIQLYLNGSTLRQECPEKVAEILSKVRLMLCSDKKYSKECKLWLLLALEVAINRFALLPADVHKFYQEQLGDQAMASFQGSHGTLTVQTTQNSSTLDSFQSNVNVLQVSTNSSADQTASPADVSDFGSSNNYSNSSGFQSDNSQKSGTNKDIRTSSNKGGKSGRPILGAGARLQRNRIQTNNSEDDWDTDKTQNNSSDLSRNKGQSNADSGNRQKNKNQKDNSGDNWRDRGNKKENDPGKKDWDKKKTPPKSKKGWEHDDRFDTDYS